MTTPSMTRRGLLATTGTALVAGCTGNDTTDGSPRINPVRLNQFVDDDPELVIADDRPVEIQQAELTTAVERVRSLLATLPMPLGSDTIPNGRIRQQLTDAAREATDRVAEARTAPNRLAALASLHRARARARFAAAGWAFVADELPTTALKAERDATATEARSVRADYRYHGADPIRAALVHALIEQFLDGSNDQPTPSRGETSELLAVAEWGENAEAARARLDAAQHLAERFRASMPADASSVEESLSTAVETLTTRLDKRTAALPSTPTDDENRIREALRRRLRNDVDESIDHVSHAPGPASGLIAATSALTTLLAYDRFNDSLGDDESVGVKTAAAVKTTRRTAVDAVTAALAESPRSDLARPILADIARSVQFADRELGSISRNVRPARLADPLAGYWTATLRARSVPTACQRTLDVVEE